MERTKNILMMIKWKRRILPDKSQRPARTPSTSSRPSSPPELRRSPLKQTSSRNNLTVSGANTPQASNLPLVLRLSLVSFSQHLSLQSSSLPIAGGGMSCVAGEGLEFQQWPWRGPQHMCRHSQSWQPPDR